MPSANKKTYGEVLMYHSEDFMPVLKGRLPNIVIISESDITVKRGNC